MDPTCELKKNSNLKRVEAKHFAIPISCFLLAWGLFEAAQIVGNAIGIWFILTPFSVFLFAGLACIVNLFSLLFSRCEVIQPAFQKKASLMIISLMLTMILFEAFLQYQAKAITFDPNDPQATRPVIPPLTMPVAWERRPVKVDKAVQAYYWHGHLHTHSGTGMRLVSAPPPKQEDVFRIMVVGDSLTYGVGVPFEKTYCSLLQKKLEKDYRVEILNLGIPGKQSQDIEQIVRFYTPSLDPDLVVYGVCLNDYSRREFGDGQEGNYLWLPLPQPLQQLLIDQTRVGRFFSEGLYTILLLTGWKNDFISQVANNYEECLSRFEDDINSISEFVIKSDLPPVIAIVLYQSSVMNSFIRGLIDNTEKILADSQMTVIPSDGYLKECSKYDLRVSVWDTHPNSIGHYFYAEALYPAILKTPKLSEYARK